MQIKVIAAMAIGVAWAAAWAGSAAAVEPALPKAVVEAGAAAVTNSLKEEAPDPAAIAVAAYSAMAGTWQPIATAPQDGSDMLLGKWRDGVFLQGIGRWQVTDEAHMPGFWSVADWFGGPPTFWAPIPVPPPAD
jgi:hypothetical protein